MLECASLKLWINSLVLGQVMHWMGPSPLYCSLHIHLGSNGLNFESEALAYEIPLNGNNYKHRSATVARAW